MNPIKIAVVALAFSFVLPAWADDPVQQNNGSSIWFENWFGLSNAILRVASPDGSIRDVRAEYGSPIYQLSGSVEDGIYRYELRAVSDELIKNRDFRLHDNESNDREFIPKSFYRSGFFVVERGMIVHREQEAEAEH